MCKPVACARCGKTTWAGCGEHVDQVKAQIAPEQWCEGHDDVGAAPPAPAPAPARGFFRRG